VTTTAILPRYQARVINVDLGLSRFYGRPPAYLVLEGRSAYVWHRQHQRWVMGLFFGALVINGVNNIFFLPGITHNVFFGL
jgi:hypothetical protein